MVLVVSLYASRARAAATSHSGRRTAATNSLSSASFTVMRCFGPVAHASLAVMRLSGSRPHAPSTRPPKASMRVSSSSVARSACGYISLKLAGGR